MLRTVNHALTYSFGLNRPRSVAMLQTYRDANFAGDCSDRRSTTGYVLRYHGRPIMWGSRKQNLLAMFTAEKKYIALAVATQHLQGIRTICVEDGLICDAPCSLKTDNLAVCAILGKPHGTKRRKIVDLKHQLLQQIIIANTITLQPLRSSQQKANMLTKPLQGVMLQIQCTVLQIQNAAPNGGM